MTSPRLAIITSRDSTDLYGDGALLPALEAEGVTARCLSWGEALPADEFDAALIRTTWDYVDDRDGFLAWCADAASAVPLANPLDILRWNTDKTYLRDLDAAAIPIVPTVWVTSSDPMPGVPWNRFVVKPTVSAGGRASASYDAARADVAAEHIAEVTSAGGTAMVQPHITSVDVDGEIGTYVVGGEVTHAVHKAALLVTGAPRVNDLSLGREQRAARADVTAELATFAKKVVDAIPHELGHVLYGRVDTVRADDGTLVLLELELVEPYLFLEHTPEAAAPFAAAVVEWLQRSRVGAAGL